MLHLCCCQGSITEVRTVLAVIKILADLAVYPLGQSTLTEAWKRTVQTNQKALDNEKLWSFGGRH